MTPGSRESFPFVGLKNRASSYLLSPLFLMAILGAHTSFPGHWEQKIFLGKYPSIFIAIKTKTLRSRAI